MDDAFTGEQLMLADHDYLAAATASGTDRTQLLQSAAEEYYAAMQHFALTILKYYVDEPVMEAIYPKDPKTGLQYNRATIENANPNSYMAILQAVNLANGRYFADPETHRYSQGRDTYADDRNNYLTYISRCQVRLQELQMKIAPKQ
jgi:hypothetical protein